MLVLAQVHQCHHHALGRTELAAAVTLTGDDEHGDPLHECMWQIEWFGTVSRGCALPQPIR